MLIGRVCAFAFVAFAVVGCGGSGVEKTVVRGNVSFENEPVENGEILFYPVESTVGPVSGATIVEGKFVADGKGGVPVGKHRVEIRAYDLSASRPTPPPDASGARRQYQPRTQYLPDRFNRKSTLFVTVPNDGTFERDFALK